MMVVIPKLNSRYKYFYWFAFPAFIAKPAWEIGEGTEGWRSADVLGNNAVCIRSYQCHAMLNGGQVASISSQLRTPDGLRPFFLVRAKAGQFEAGAVEDFETFFQGSSQEDVSQLVLLMMRCPDYFVANYRLP